MPIKPELRKFYGREWRKVTRPQILARAGNRCERCQVPNRKVVARVGGFWKLVGQKPWHNEHGEVLAGVPLDAARFRIVEIVLTIAHVNHTPGDDREDNLEALCQWHHLRLDQAQHKQTRATRKDAARPLLQEIQDARA
jgi:hypothetical protein